MIFLNVLITLDNYYLLACNLPEFVNISKRWNFRARELDSSGNITHSNFQSTFSIHFQAFRRHSYQLS